jgi:hypothetical protein
MEFEVDPEHYSYHLPSIVEGKKLFRLHEDFEELKYLEDLEAKNEVWYKHKGNIDIKYLFPYQISQYNTFPPGVIDMMNFDIHNKELLDAGMSKHDLEKMKIKLKTRFEIDHSKLGMSVYNQISQDFKSYQTFRRMLSI